MVTLGIQSSEVFTVFQDIASIPGLFIIILSERYHLFSNTMLKKPDLLLWEFRQCSSGFSFPKFLFLLPQDYYLYIDDPAVSSSFTLSTLSLILLSPRCCSQLSLKLLTS